MLLLLIITIFVFNNVYTQEDTEIETDMMMARLISHHSCRLDRDCRPNSFCIGNDATNTGFCRCEDGFIISRNRTFYECLLPAAGLNSTCTRDLECTFTLGNPSSCVNGSCQCNENAHFAITNNQCYVTSSPGEICDVDFNCLLGDGAIGTCHVGRCRCPVRHHPTADGRCVSTSRLGENCTTDDNCRHTFANCIGVCRCLPGHVVSENGRRCLQAATEFNQPCDEMAQCSTYLAGSFCSNETCVCNPGFHPLGPRCWRTVVAGGRCTDRRECFFNQGSEDAEVVDCSDGICTCNADFDNVRGDCLRRSGEISIYASVKIMFCVMTMLMWLR